MKFSRSIKLILVFAAMAAVFGGCALFPGKKEVVPPPPALELPEDPSDYIVYADFTNDELGAFPEDWTMSDRTVDNVKVVESDLASGRAVRIQFAGNQSGDSHFKHVTWGDKAADVTTIGVEYKFKWTEGTGIHLNVTSSPHHINFSIDETGRLRYRDDSKNITLAGSEFKDGWNHLRYSANLETDEVIIYFNDMHYPIAGPLMFRTPLTSWEDVNLLLLHGKNDTDIEYGEIKVWSLD